MTTTAKPIDSPVLTNLQGSVGIVEMRRPPHNYFDLDMLTALADAFEALDRDPACRAVVLAAEGKSFCAGANFGGRKPGEVRPPSSFLYRQAVRLFSAGKPVVAAVHGPAVGGGLGVALVADFRVTCAEARFSANFVRLGFHPGFGLSVTLARLIGQQQAALLLLTGRRIGGEEALSIGLADLLVPANEVRAQAIALAQEIAVGAPLAVQATRRSLRTGLAEAVQRATEQEAVAQEEHFRTQDFAEGVAAMAERREPRFSGR